MLKPFKKLTEKEKLQREKQVISALRHGKKEKVGNVTGYKALIKDLANETGFSRFVIVKVLKEMAENNKIEKFGDVYVVCK